MMDKVRLPRKRLGEEALSFIPIKNTGSRAFTLAFADGVLYLYSAGKKYKIILTEEE